MLVQLKEREKLSWDEIEQRFPDRTRAALQVHYSTKLKARLQTSRETRSRRRPG